MTRARLTALLTAAALAVQAPPALADPLDPADLYGDGHDHADSGQGLHGDHFAEALMVPEDPFVVDSTTMGPQLMATQPHEWVGAPPDPGMVAAEWQRVTPAETIRPSTTEELMAADTGYFAALAEDGAAGTATEGSGPTGAATQAPPVADEAVTTAAPAGDEAATTAAPGDDVAATTAAPGDDVAATTAAPGDDVAATTAAPESEVTESQGGAVTSDAPEQQDAPAEESDQDQVVVDDGTVHFGTTAVKAPPSKRLPSTLDASAGWQYTYSCDPNNKTGMVKFGQLVGQHYGYPTFYTSRSCIAGDNSQHYEGRALDWPMNAYNRTQKAVGDSVAQWLTANNGEMARRFGVMSVIWNRKSWYISAPGRWYDYTGPSPHTDHLHISFTWDGAIGRTSWWTGSPVTTVDYGTCRVYSGQYAPRYTGRRTSPCPTSLPQPPKSDYPVVLPNARNSYVETAQRHLGFSGSDADGSFGPLTLAALLDYQKARGLPVTGVLDKATWHAFATQASRSNGSTTGYDGDAHGDVLVRRGNGNLVLFSGDGRSSVGSGRVVGRGWHVFRDVAFAGDLDSDGQNDIIAVTEAGALWLYPGNGRGGQSSRTLIGARGWQQYLDVEGVGDLNGDGSDDIIARGKDGKLWLYTGKGNGFLTGRELIGRAGWQHFQEIITLGDFNGDGWPDLAARADTGELFLYSGTSSGRLGSREQIGRGWHVFSNVFSPGDMNSDGKADIYATTPGAALHFYAGDGSEFYPRGAVANSGWYYRDIIGMR